MTKQAGHTAGADWYERCDELEEGQIFSTLAGEIVRLDRRVPGDGTDRYVADWWNGWSYMDSKIHPGDLFQRFDDVNTAIAAAKGGAS